MQDQNRLFPLFYSRELGFIFHCLFALPPRQTVSPTAPTLLASVAYSFNFSFSLARGVLGASESCGAGVGLFPFSARLACLAFSSIRLMKISSSAFSLSFSVEVSLVRGQTAAPFLCGPLAIHAAATRTLNAIMGCNESSFLRWKLRTISSLLDRCPATLDVSCLLLFWSSSLFLFLSALHLTSQLQLDPCMKMSKSKNSAISQLIYSSASEI